MRRRANCFSFAALAVLLHWTARPSPADRQAAEFVIREEVLDRLHPETPPLRHLDNVPVYVDPTQHHVAWLAAGDGKEWIVLDGKPQRRYDRIEPLRDLNAEGAAFLFPLPAHIIFSPTGERYSYIGRKAGKLYLVVDGKEHEVRSVPVLRFAANGRFGYVDTWRIENKQDVGIERIIRSRVFIEGLPAREYSCAIEGPLFSPDGRRVAYLVLEEHREYVVLDGQPLRRYESIPFGIMSFSPDGSRFGFLGDKGKSYAATINGTEFKAIAPYGIGGTIVGFPERRGLTPTAFGRSDFLTPTMLVVGPGARYASHGHDGGSIVVVVDGKRGGPYDDASLLFQSKDGARIAFTAWRDERSTFVGGWG